MSAENEDVEIESDPSDLFPGDLELAAQLAHRRRLQADGATGQDAEGAAQWREQA